MNYKKENIKAVILAGGCDFRLHSAGMHLSPPLWPVADKSVLEHLLISLADQGIKKAAVCFHSDNSFLRESINTGICPELEFVEESLPLGSAGCVRAAVCDDANMLLLVFAASLVCPPDIGVLIDTHHASKADLTVVFNPAGDNGKTIGEFAGIYVCDTNVLKYIPESGYFDMKEGLMPEMLRASKNIHAAILPAGAGNFRSWREYLSAIGSYLENRGGTDLQMKVFRQDNLRTVWTAGMANIDPGARIYGSVAVMQGARVAKDAVIIGPVILGRNIVIGRNSVIVNSVLWDDVKVGSNCSIQHCVLDYNMAVRNNTVVENKFLTREPVNILTNSVGMGLEAVGKNVDKLRSVLLSRLEKIGLLPAFAQFGTGKIGGCLIAGLLLIALLWSYWPNFVDIWKIWQSSDEYSSGILVPFLAVYVLWSRRHKISHVGLKPSIWGLFAFAAAQAFRFFGLFFMYGSAERLSIILSIAALVLLVFGWQLFWKVSTILLFLFLMLPWPNRIQAAMALPLQNWATSSAVFCLEIIGYEIVREGNIIHVGQTTVAVAEACNGLRMITAFFVISGLVVLLVNRKWWEKLIVLVSCLPIALFCNTIRLVVTSIAFTMLSGEQWERIFHDFGGYAMMPLALGLTVAELFVLTKLTTPPAQEKRQ